MDVQNMQQFVFTLAPIMMIVAMILGVISTIGGFALKIVESKKRAARAAAAKADDDDDPGTKPETRQRRPRKDHDRRSGGHTTRDPLPEPVQDWAFTAPIQSPVQDW